VSGMDKAQPDPNRRFQAALDRARAGWLAHRLGA